MYQLIAARFCDRFPAAQYVWHEQRVEGGDVPEAEGLGPPHAGAGTSAGGGQAAHLVRGHERQVRSDWNRVLKV